MPAYFNRFRISVIVRVLLLGSAIFSFLYFLDKEGYLMTKAVLGIAVIYIVYGLIHFIERSNRDLERFLQSIQNDDFTQTYPVDNLGRTFDDLRKSFNRVMKQFQELRSDKEGHVRYLQTVIKHVRVGLISFKSDGHVQLLNTAAMDMFGIDHLNNIKNLEQFSKPLVEKLLHLKPGENTSLKIGSAKNPLHLSISATQFKLQGELFTLVSLHDIQVEIEKEHLAKELEIAWNVQKSLLPHSNPHLPGFDIAGTCRPADEVGGDYYDFIPVGDNKLVMIIADVSGKGTPAAFYMTLTKGFIQSHIKENASPKEILVNVNRLMCDTIDNRSFVTMFIAVLDRETNKITCARAGHNAAIHYSAVQQTSISIKPGGIALGLRRGDVFARSIQECELQIHEDDWLILYTDGFVEAVDDHSREFGEKRLHLTLAGNHHLEAAQLVDTIFKEVENFAGNGKQYDDMTIIALHCTALPPAVPASSMKAGS